MTPSPQTTIRISEPQPYGDVTLAPAAITGRPESELARMMALALRKASPPSGAEALKLLRSSFPGSPLAARVAALGVATLR